MKTKTITIAALAAVTMWISACSLFRKPTGKPEEEVKKVAYADKILLHMHPEKVLNYLPELKDVQIAYLFGITVEDYQKARKEYDDQAKKAATGLLDDPDFAKKIDGLRFKKDETILVLGESTTDALNSWAVILKHLLEQRRPQDNIKVINAAVSGQTTTEALKRITTQVKQNPDWVLCFLGSNDCGRYGSEANKTNVSISETLSNLNTIWSIVSTETKAKFVWLAPAPINEKKVSAFPPFKQMKLYVKNSDLLAIADGMKMRYENVIDFRDALGVPANAEYMQFDGAHYTIEGQKLIVSHLIKNLTIKN